jgi:hypothetical protein
MNCAFWSLKQITQVSNPRAVHAVPESVQNAQRFGQRLYRSAISGRAPSSSPVHPLPPVPSKNSALYEETCRRTSARPGEFGLNLAH